MRRSASRAAKGRPLRAARRADLRVESRRRRIGTAFNRDRNGGVAGELVQRAVRKCRPAWPRKAPKSPPRRGRAQESRFAGATTNDDEFYRRQASHAADDRTRTLRLSLSCEPKKPKYMLPNCPVITVQGLSCAPGVEREILSSSSFMSADTSANRGVLK
jgi:hypothetical protein